MNRILAISDIHGSFLEFNRLLEKVNFNKENDTLIILGDMIDRGDKSKDVIQKVMSMVENKEAIALGGNHEELFLSWLDDPYDSEEELYFPLGGKATVKSFCEEIGSARFGDEARKLILSHYEKEIEFLRNLPSYYELKEYIFVHAGVNLSLLDWRNSNESDFKWIRHRFWHEKNETGKTIVFGHTPTFQLDPDKKSDPYFFPTGDKIAIDGGYVFGGQLNCLEILDGNIKNYKITYDK